MDWIKQDDKKERGLIDRIFVSPTEDHELRYFVNHYLQSNKYAESEENRQKVKNAIYTFPGKAPILRNKLTAFLNKKFRKH